MPDDICLHDDRADGRRADTVNLTPAQLASALFDKYKIHTVGIVWENISCVRVTPHVYTTIPDLDKMVRAIGELSQA